MAAGLLLKKTRRHIDVDQPEKTRRHIESREDPGNEVGYRSTQKATRSAIPDNNGGDSEEN